MPNGPPDSPRYTEDMTNPQTMIQQRIIARAKELGMSPEEIAASVAVSPLYGEFTHSTYRNLVTWDFECGRANRVTFNRQLIIALSEVLQCHVSDLATDYELQSIRELPYRRAQWPAFLLEKDAETSTGKSVPMPGKTASIVVAYMKQRGPYSFPNFAARLTSVGYPINGRQLVRAIGPNRNANYTRRYVTYEFCEAVARIFRRGPFGPEEFEPEWLINCNPDRCPHCDPRLISY